MHRFAFLLLLVPTLAHAEPEPVHAALVAEMAQVTPGQTFTAAVDLQIAKGWHVYAKDHGEIGTAPSVQWRAHDDFMVWPQLNVTVDQQLMGYSSRHSQRNREVA